MSPNVLTQSGAARMVPSSCVLTMVHIAACLLALRTLARAATITANSLADPGAPGVCSLRDAITAANTKTATHGCVAGTGNDTIQFSVTGTILLASTLPTVTDGLLTINGSASPGLTIDGGGAVQVMVVASGATVKLNRLTIADGETDVGGTGGGILSNGTLTITNSTFSGNDANQGTGGGILSNGTLTVSNSTFSGNSAFDGFGGGILSNGTLTVTNSTFFANSNVEGDGAGILSNGTATVTNSTFSDNVEGGVGAGIFTDGTLIVTNSTFSGNTPAGIWNNTGTATITNSTLSGNSFGVENLGTLAVTNSTLSGNSPGIENDGTLAVTNSTILAASPGGNCAGTITDAGYNISDDKSCGFAKTGSANNGDGVDPRLDSDGLQNNGGPTKTIALQLHSPAIDSIPVADCTDQSTPPKPIATDQRGFPRPDAKEQVCDIGAYEFQDFGGQPGQANCLGESVSALAQQFGSIKAAAAVLHFPSVRALQAAIRAFCAR